MMLIKSSYKLRKTIPQGNSNVNINTNINTNTNNNPSYRFYKQLGFDDVYTISDTRYQTKGIFLETVRAPKIMMRKLI